MDFYAFGTNRRTGYGPIHPGRDADTKASAPVRPAFHAKHWHGHHGPHCSLERQKLQGLSLFSNAPTHWTSHGALDSSGL